jgi:Spy/CpxP family protein refolding chaperone
MDRSARTKLVAALVLSAVFASGLLLGFAADSNRAPEANDGVPVATAPESASQGERPRRPMVYEQLNPSPEQRAVIDSIFVVHRARMNALDKEYRDVRHEYQARYDAVIQDTRAAIAGVFPPDVAAEYRRLLAEYDERREAERAAERAERE